MGKKTAENLTIFIEDKIKSQVENNSQMLAKRDDLHQEVSRLEHQIGNLKADLEIKISDSKTDTIKWMFIFWVGQVVATFGFILLFIKKS